MQTISQVIAGWNSAFTDAQSEAVQSVGMHLACTWKQMCFVAAGALSKTSACITIHYSSSWQGYQKVEFFLCFHPGKAAVTLTAALSTTFGCVSPARCSCARTAGTLRASCPTPQGTACSDAGLENTCLIWAKVGGQCWGSCGRARQWVDEGKGGRALTSWICSQGLQVIWKHLLLLGRAGEM